MSKLKAYCNVCKSEQTIIEERVPKFSKFIRAVGLLIAIASIFAGLISVLFYFSTAVTDIGLFESLKNGPEAGETMLVAEFQLIYSVFLCVFAILGGVVSWILLKKKKAYKCYGCGQSCKVEEIY
jgi:hypothetical protein